MEEIKDWGVDIPQFVEEPDLNIDQFFNEEKKAPTKKKVIKCPHCGEDIEL